MSRESVPKTGGYAVESAIREGKIPESRRAHYMALMAKNPKKTARLLASLYPALSPPDSDMAVDLSDVRDHHVEAGRAEGRLMEEASVKGPTAYPKEWLGAPEAAAQPGGGGTVTFEDGTAAAQSLPGGGI